MIAKAKGTIGGLTDLGLALLALAIVLTLLVGAGNMAFFGGVVGNITALVAAERTAAWADVARRIAHEIRNPLTPIQLSAERLKRKYSKEIIFSRVFY